MFASLDGCNKATWPGAASLSTHALLVPRLSEFLSNDRNSQARASDPSLSSTTSTHGFEQVLNSGIEPSYDLYHPLLEVLLEPASRASI